MVMSMLGNMLFKRVKGYGLDIYEDPCCVSEVLTNKGLYLKELTKHGLVVSGRTLFSLYHDKKLDVFEFYKFKNDSDESEFFEDWVVKKHNRTVTTYIREDICVRVVQLDIEKTAGNLSKLCMDMDLNVFFSLFDPEEGVVLKNETILNDLENNTLRYNEDTFIPKTNTEVMLTVVKNYGYTLPENMIQRNENKKAIAWYWGQP